MILDRLDQIQQYAALHPSFEKAFAFLHATDLACLAPGKHDIDGQRIYAIVARDPGRLREEARLEAHRRYIDIQCVLSGTDNMGWKNRSLCKMPHVPYDAEKDAELFSDPPDAWISVGPGAFAMFFPDDAHAPLVGAGEIHKVIVKIATD